MKELITKIVLKIKRCYKNSNKPVIRKEFDTNIALYANEDAEESILKANITGDVKIKVLDLILVLVAISCVFSIICGVFSIFKK